MAELDDVLAFLARNDELVAERTRPFPGGTMLLSPGVPELWDANHAQLRSTWDGTAAELDAALAAEGRAAGLRHRMVSVPDPDEAKRLAPGLAELGYRRDPHLVMLGRRGADREPATVPELVPVGAVAGLRAGLWSDVPGIGEADLRRILAWEARSSGILADRWLAAFEGGQVGSCAQLITRDGIAQIENVGTVPAVRGRGLASSVVLGGARLLRAEGATTVVIVASALDWPKELYERLGFDGVATIERFRLRVP